MNIILPLIAIYGINGIISLSLNFSNGLNVPPVGSGHVYTMLADAPPSDPYGSNPHGANPHGPDPHGDPHDENHDPNLPANNDQQKYYGPKDPYGNPQS